jgi:hypothetical protein
MSCPRHVGTCTYTSDITQTRSLWTVTFRDMVHEPTPTVA